MNSNDRVIVSNVELLGSWPTLNKMPSFGWPEVAMLGRSNVGKSSFINSVIGRSLARVSATPGKTRDAVLFKVDLKQGTVAKSFVLTDLPGFGYAKVSKDQQSQFHSLLSNYLKKRPALSALCLLNDCRREPAEDEQLLWTVAEERALKRFLVVTKLDKLNRGEQAKASRLLSDMLPGADVVVPSGTKVDSSVFMREVYRLIAS